ncbi:MAG: hypothetical protein ABF811_10045 [Pseudoclavibacter sp.]
MQGKLKLASVIAVSIFSLSTISPILASADTTSTQATSRASSTESITVGNTIYSVSPTLNNSVAVSLARKHNYINGVNKIKKSGKYTTIYISKHSARLIVEGSGIVIGGYTGRALGVLLGLAGLGSREAIKGGIWIKTMNIEGTDGIYRTVVVSWGWQ